MKSILEQMLEVEVTEDAGSYYIESGRKRYKIDPQPWVDWRTNIYEENDVTFEETVTYEDCLHDYLGRPEFVFVGRFSRCYGYEDNVYTIELVNEVRLKLQDNVVEKLNKLQDTTLSLEYAIKAYPAGTGSTVFVMDEDGYEMKYAPHKKDPYLKANSTIVLNFKVEVAA